MHPRQHEHHEKYPDLHGDQFSTASNLRWVNDYVSNVRRLDAPTKRVHVTNSASAWCEVFGPDSRNSPPPPLGAGYTVLGLVVKFSRDMKTYMPSKLVAGTDSPSMPVEKKQKTENEGKRAREARKLKKRRKTEEETVEQYIENSGWTQCHFFLKHKQKCCGVEPVKGSNYCGIHRFDGEGGGASGASRTVPCPVDPTHSVLESNLKKHLKCCNAAVILAKLQTQPYYCKDCNSGSAAVEAGPLAAAAVDADALLDKLRDINMEIMVLPPPSKGLLPYEQVIVEQMSGGKTSNKRVRHPQQDASIVRVMAESGIITGVGVHTTTTSSSSGGGGSSSSSCSSSSSGVGAPREVFVEMGAGKGLLGFAVLIASPGTDVVLVERGAGYQMSADKYVRDRVAAGDASDGAFSRVTIDLRDCVTAALPGVVEQQGHKRAVVGAKHLCGVASDLALRSLASFGGRLAADVAGLGIATCCHHCCNWEDYVGRDFLASKGVTGAEFAVMCGWTSWATSLRMHTKETKVRKGEAEAEVEHSAAGERQLRSNERHRPKDAQPSALRLAGWWAKRAIDEGRAAFLRSLGMDAFQRYYCDKDVTPECVMLVGTPK